MPGIGTRRAPDGGFQRDTFAASAAGQVMPGNDALLVGACELIPAAALVGCEDGAVENAVRRHVKEIDF